MDDRNSSGHLLDIILLLATGIFCAGLGGILLALPGQEATFLRVLGWVLLAPGALLTTTGAVAWGVLVGLTAHARRG